MIINIRNVRMTDLEDIHRIEKEKHFNKKNLMKIEGRSDNRTSFSLLDMGKLIWVEVPSVP